MLSGNPFGDYLQERRKDAGLTREQLADRSNLSVSLIEKIERGARPATIPTLSTLFDGLAVPLLHRRHVLALAVPDIHLRPATPALPPSPADLADLASLDHPASYYLMPTFTIVAANVAHERAFPGLRPGTNFVEWMFLNPLARTVMTDWDRDAHRLVDCLRSFAPLHAGDDHLATVIANCRNARGWADFWDARPSARNRSREVIHIRDPRSELSRRMALRLYTPEFPSRPWWLCRLVPTAR